jgi:hypothetical protein
MIGAVLLMAAVSAGEAVPAGAGATSALCMAPLPGARAFASAGKGAATESYDDSDAARSRRRAARYAFIVEVDGKGRIRVDQKSGGCVDGLAYQGTHVAVLRWPDGGSAGAARFSFERRGVTELELRYDAFYATVSVEKPRHPRRSTAPGASAAASSERSLGTLDGWSEHVTVPEQGLRFTFRAPTVGTRHFRTMLDVTASAAAVDGHPAVRLTTSVSGRPGTSSSSSCFEANVREPPFQTCTAKAGSGWDDGAARDVVLTIDNLAGKPVSVDLRIVVMDPLE